MSPSAWRQSVIEVFVQVLWSICLLRPWRRPAIVTKTYALVETDRYRAQQLNQFTTAPGRRTKGRQ